MTLLYIIAGLIIAGLFIKFTNTKKDDNSPYLKIKKKLDEDLLLPNFSGDWKRRQEINLQLLWLKTLYEVEIKNGLGGFNIKFPLKWKLEDLYCYPFSQEIISAYGRVIAENDYRGVFKPDSILPVPKKYIRKAILFTFDYFNSPEPMYKVADKDKIADNLSMVNLLLDMTFIDTGNDDLPKSGRENLTAGNIIKEKLPEHNELEDLSLVDWRTENDWIFCGARYSDKKQYDYAFACYDRVKKINPESKELKPYIFLTYLSKGEQHHKNGENELAIENIRKAAELNNEEATKWLKQHFKENSEKASEKAIKAIQEMKKTPLNYEEELKRHKLIQEKDKEMDHLYRDQENPKSESL